MASSAKNGKIVGFVVFASSFLLYLATLAPTFLWSDSAKLAIAVHEKQFAATSFGAHPMHALLGYLFSSLPSSFAYTQNLMSAFFASATVAFVYLIVRLETNDTVAGVLAATSLAVSHIFWMYGVINETYSLLAFFLAVCVYCSLKYIRENSVQYLYVLAFLLGAGFANHAMMLIFVPGIVVLLLKRTGLTPLRTQHALILLACFIVGAVPVFILPLFEGLTPLKILASLGQTTEEHYQTFSSGISKLFRQVVFYPIYLLYQFPGVAFIAAFFAIRKLWEQDRRLFVATFLILIFTVVFASQYFMQRQFPMLIPSFVIIAIWSGYGFARWRERYPVFRNQRVVLVVLISVILLPPLIYYSSYRSMEKRDLGFIRTLPYRDNARYFLYPPKHMERGAEQYVEDSFWQAQEGAILLSDFNPGMALLYGQKVLGKRKDLQIEILIDDWIHHSKDPGVELLKYVREKTDQNRTLYLADRYEPYYHSSILTPEFHLDQSGGPLWKISKRGE